MEKLLKLLQDRKATYVEKTPSDVYREVAHKFEHFTPEDIAAIGGAESSHGKFEKPIKGGSARGLFQFQPQTAEYLQPGSSESLLDSNTQSELMQKYLEKTGATNIEDAYAMHNLGPTRGKKLIDAEGSQPISELIPRNVVRSNPGLYKVKNAKQAKENISQKLKQGTETSDLPISILDLLFNGEK